MAPPAETYLIRFLQGNGPYNAGERATFPADVARTLVKRGVGKLVNAADAAKLDLGLLAPAEPAAAPKDDGGPSPDTRTHDLSVGDAAALIKGIDDAAVLERLWAGEQAHPKSEGGRKGVLDALRKRAAELKEQE